MFREFLCQYEVEKSEYQMPDAFIGLKLWFFVFACGSRLYLERSDFLELVLMVSLLFTCLLYLLTRGFFLWF